METIKSLGQLFRLVSGSDLASVAGKYGFKKIDLEESFLPSGKSLENIHFRRNGLMPCSHGLKKPYASSI